MLPLIFVTLNFLLYSLMNFMVTGAVARDDMGSLIDYLR
jgi:hypothetical protein